MPGELVMIWIIIVMLIVLSSLKANKKAQQKGQAAKGKPAQPQDAAKLAQSAQTSKAVKAARTQAKPAAKSAFMQAMAELQEAFAEPQKPQTPPNGSFVPRENAAPQAAKPAQGVSMLDEEGCVGGSMAHTHTEGESRAEHGRHQAAARRREAQEMLEAQVALELSAMNLRRLRQAVVMAEILDKPKALRRKHY